MDINNIAFENFVEINGICEPLWRFGIHYFSYNKIFKDGTRIEINNHPDMSNDYFLKYKMFVDSAVEAEADAMPDGLLLWSSHPDEPGIMLARDKFQVSNGFSIIDNRDDYTEMYHLGTSVDNVQGINFYLNHLDLIKTFIYHFRDKAAKLLKNKPKDEVLVLTPPGRTLSAPKEIVTHISEHDKQQFLSDLDIKTYHLGPKYNNAYLTRREAEVLKFTTIGKTAAEIGMIFQCSPRTVEEHLRKVKSKLDCYKQTLLVKIAMDLGIA